jgi:hypothetical protein
VTADERDLLLSALVLMEEHGAEVGLTRPVMERLEYAPDLQDRAVREALAALGPREHLSGYRRRTCSASSTALRPATRRAP